MAAGTGSSPRGVFINCPFTADYRPLMDAMVFTVLACGFRPRSALEAGNSGDVRVDKIMSRRKSIPGPNLVIAAYESFQLALPEICDRAGLDIGELPFVERVGLAKTWLKQAA